MVMSKEDRVLIKILCEVKGHNTRQLMMQFPIKGRKKCSIKRLLQKLRNNSTADSDLNQHLTDTWASVPQKRHRQSC